MKTSCNNVIYRTQQYYQCFSYGMRQRAIIDTFDVSCVRHTGILLNRLKNKLMSITIMSYEVNTIKVTYLKHNMQLQYIYIIYRTCPVPPSFREWTCRLLQPNKSETRRIETSTKFYTFILIPPPFVLHHLHYVNFVIL